MRSERSHMEHPFHYFLSDGGAPQRRGPGKTFPHFPLSTGLNADDDGGDYICTEQTKPYQRHFCWWIWRRGRTVLVSSPPPTRDWRPVGYECRITTTDPSNDHRRWRTWRAKCRSRLCACCSGTPDDLEPRSHRAEHPTTLDTWPICDPYRRRRRAPSHKMRGKCFFLGGGGNAWDLERAWHGGTGVDNPFGLESKNS